MAKNTKGREAVVSPLLLREMEETGMQGPPVESDSSVSTTDIDDTKSVTSTVNWDEVAKGLKKKTKTGQTKSKAEPPNKTRIRGTGRPDHGNYPQPSRHDLPSAARHKRFTLFMRRFRCLCWGNLFFRHRYRIVTAIEIIFPPVCCMLIFLAFTRGVTWTKVVQERNNTEILLPQYTTQDIYDTFVLDRDSQNSDTAGRIKLIYFPRSNFTDTIMQSAIERLGVGIKNKCNVQDVHRGFGCAGVDTVMEVIELCMFHRLDTGKHGKPIGVIFNLNDTGTDADGIPFKLMVTISTFHPQLADTNDNHPFVRPPDSRNWKTPYHKFGFLGLQMAIEDSFTAIVYKNTDTNLQKNLSQMVVKGPKGGAVQMAWDACIMQRSGVQPSTISRILKPQYVAHFFDGNARRLMTNTIIITLVVSYISICYFIVRQIVIEKQSKIKDLLQMHSLPYHYHWILLVAQAILFRTITALGVSAALYIDYGYGAIITHSPFLPIFFVIWLHVICLSFFNFFLATILNSIMFSGIYAICMCVLTYALPATLAKSDFIGFTPNLVLCILFPNWALQNFVVLLIEQECDEEGISWVNFNKRSTHKNASHLGSLDISLILIASGGVYLTLAILNDLSNQTRLESDLKWYQCFQKCRRRLRKSKSSNKASVAPIDTTVDDKFKKPGIYEKKGVETEKCIVHVRNLSKLYGKHRLVLDNISMNFAQGEITVILGHTDAGKSSLIHCLAGMVPPTTGFAMINGYNVTTETGKARQSMGLCPQEVITFNLLTVHQHLALCYKLRGLSNEDANQESGKLLKLLRLQEVRGNIPSEVTRDERRKLGIAMCLVDSPSVILLDEPTIGMSILETREIWSILRDLKKDGRTIILTTNRMDEAEMLADRIAVLTHGKLTCYGRPAFLKQQYDTGYILRITPAFKLFLDKVIALGQKHLGGSFKEHKVKSIEDKDFVLIDLPKTQITKFPAMLDELEQQKYHLGIASYEVQQISLADVFIKISEAVADNSEFTPDVYERKNSKTGEWSSALSSQLPSFSLEERIKPSNLDHFHALFRKQWIYTHSRIWIILVEILLPLILILGAVIESNVFTSATTPPASKVLLKETFPKAIILTRIEAGGLWNASQTIREVIGHKHQQNIKQDLSKFLREEYINETTILKTYEPEKRMMALEFKPHSSVTLFLGYFSTASLHAPPVIMNLITNIILHELSHSVIEICNKTVAALIQGTALPEDEELDKDAVIYKVTITNAPFPDLKDRAPLDAGCTIRCVLFAILVSIGCGLIAASNINLPMEERSSGMKQVQLMGGVSPVMYWATIFVASLIFYFVATVLISLIFSLNWIGRAYFEESEAKFILFLFIGLFLCWSSIPWTFYISTIIPINFSGYKMVVILHILLGILPTLFLKNMLAPTRQEKSEHYLLHYFFYLFPPFSITACFQDWFEIVSQKGGCNIFPPMIEEMCNRRDDQNAAEMEDLYKYILDHDLRLGRCCRRICSNPRINHTTCFKLPTLLDMSREKFRNPHLVTDILSLIFQGFLYWLLLIISERRIMGHFVQKVVLKFVKSQERRRTKEKLREDIKREKRRVSSIVAEGKLDDAALICQDLTKSYSTHMVINNVNFTLNKGECIGLLGGGGSGKSTVIQMLAGESIPTRGTAFIGGHNLILDRKKYLLNIGYCPQTNCLFTNFTGVQMMELIGRIKGVPKTLLAVHVKKWLQVFGLAEAANDQCEEYSPSMKRRLCIALALMGGDPVLLFDEPTHGFDPLSKLRFWSIIKQLTRMGHSVVFSSFSVDECTKAATRLLVFSEGSVQCTGTPAELKERFSQGFSLLIRVRYDSLTPLELVSSTVGQIVEIKKSVAEKFRHLTLRDEQDVFILYFLRDTKLTWGEVFRKAEEIKVIHDNIIENYFISKASLDDVFILLTNKYRELDKPRRMESSLPGELTKYEAEKAALDEAAKKLKF